MHLGIVCSTVVVLGKKTENPLFFLVLVFSKSRLGMYFFRPFRGNLLCQTEQASSAKAAFCAWFLLDSATVEEKRFAVI